MILWKGRRRGRREEEVEREEERIREEEIEREEERKKKLPRTSAYTSSPISISRKRGEEEGREKFSDELRKYQNVDKEKQLNTIKNLCDWIGKINKLESFFKWKI